MVLSVANRAKERKRKTDPRAVRKLVDLFENQSSVGAN